MLCQTLLGESDTAPRTAFTKVAALRWCIQACIPAYVSYHRPTFATASESVPRNIVKSLGSNRVRRTSVGRSKLRYSTGVVSLVWFDIVLGGVLIGMQSESYHDKPRISHSK